MKLSFLPVLAIALLAGCRPEQEVAPAPVGGHGPEFAPYGKKVVVTKPIVVDGGKVIDGALPGGKVTYYEPKGLGDGSQKEGQQPVFIVKWGAVENVRIGRDADGIHLRPYAGKTARVRNIQVPDVGEDAVTVNGDGKAIIERSLFAKADDKAIQINKAESVLVKDCTWFRVGKCVRTCGTCGNRPYNVTISGGRATEVDVVLKMSNSKARAKVSGVKLFGGKLVELSGGAKADTD